MTMEDNSDEEIDERKHQELVENVLSINKSRHLKKPSRSEPSIEVSEFDLVKSLTGRQGTVEINNLLSSIKSKKNERLKRKLEKAGKVPTLAKPLEKPQSERIRRAVAYEKTRLELDRWEPIVMSNRVSNLSFPMRTATKMDREQDLTKRWRLKNLVDEEYEKIVPDLTQTVVDEFPLSVAEAMERRKEMAKLRAHQSYREAKARRTNKIKSKKFHRIQRRAKIKEQLKEFELLQKVNPEEALRRLEEIEKTRAHERFSLRHRSTGKWAKNKQIRAKYDKESRQELAEQLTISKELTQKLNKDSSDSEVEDEDEQDLNDGEDDNPWTNNFKVEPEVSEFYSSYRNFWSNDPQESADKIKKDSPINKKEKKVRVDNKNKETKKVNATSDWKVDKSIDIIFDEIDQKLRKRSEDKLKTIKETKKPKRVKKAKLSKAGESLLALRPEKKKAIIDEELLESTNAESQIDSKIIPTQSRETETEIDPNKYLNVKVTHLDSELPDVVTVFGNEKQSDLVAEAFEDDDLVTEFRKEKEEEIEKNNPKAIDLHLPGWGDWGGAGVRPNKRKQRRFIVKPAPKFPRKDENKGDLIINEEESNKTLGHSVTEIPFPFENAKDFEASIRAPIGNTFVPETAFRKLIRPSVRTKSGQIIEPMDKEVLLNKTNP